MQITIPARNLQAGDQIIACSAEHYAPAEETFVTRAEVSTDDVLVGLWLRRESGSGLTQLSANADVVIVRPEA